MKNEKKKNPPPPNKKKKKPNQKNMIQSFHPQGIKTTEFNFELLQKRKTHGLSVN